jgi:hypothetical protein
VLVIGAKVVLMVEEMAVPAGTVVERVAACGAATASEESAARTKEGVIFILKRMQVAGVPNSSFHDLTFLYVPRQTKKQPLSTGTA